MKSQSDKIKLLETQRAEYLRALNEADWQDPEIGKQIEKCWREHILWIDKEIQLRKANPEIIN